VAVTATTTGYNYVLNFLWFLGHLAIIKAILFVAKLAKGPGKMQPLLTDFLL
jgi:hypothetical protein